MSLQQYLLLLRRRWRWVVSLAIAGVVLATGSSLLATPEYRATGSLFFSLQSGTSGNDLAQGANFTQGQVASYALLAGTPAVLQPVVEELELDTSARHLAGQVTARVVPDTVVVEVTVTDPDPERAALLANSIADQLVATVEALAPVDDAQQASVRATTVAPAVAPLSPATPRTMMNTAVGLLGGLLAGLVVALLRDLTDTRVRTPEDLRRVTLVPLLAALDTPPRRSGARDLVVVGDPHGPSAEAYRGLRTSVQFLGERGRALSLVVTSARSGEGKSTVAANLALALAEAGARVVLVDADLRRPSVADTLGLEGAAGLTTVLIGRAELDDVLQEWGPAGLSVLTTGALPPNPSELLGSPAMAATMAELEANHDVVLIDTAPVLPVTDAVVLSGMASGTVVVVDADRTTRAQLGEALGGLAAVDARVVGVVMTHVRQRRGEAYRYEQVDEAAWSPVLDASPGQATRR